MQKTQQLMADHDYILANLAQMERKTKITKAKFYGLLELNQYPTHSGGTKNLLPCNRLKTEPLYNYLLN